MDKTRYQVFVSSTYADLVAERSAIFDAVTQIDCIPAGMETFPAFDEAQLDYIKRIIDDSDYYVLVIGGRYGSLSEKKISFTEEEYDYALLKELPILSFIHNEPDSIAVGKTDQDREKSIMLKKFITKVKAGRIIKTWSNSDELTLRVTQALNQTIKSRPGIGWVRGNTVASIRILEEINEVRRENSILKAEVDQLKLSIGTEKSLDLTPLSIQTLRFRFKAPYQIGAITTSIRLSWNDILKIIGPAFRVPHFSSSIGKALKIYLNESGGQNASSVDVFIEDINIVIAQFSALGFIVKSENLDGKFVLTNNGDKKLLELLTVKNSTAS